MDAEEFRKCGKELVDMVANYLETIRQLPVLPDVQPGYIRDLVPNEAPEKAEKWQDVLKDVEKVIIPGMTHWSSPHFHAYFPTANSYPAMCADILGSALTCIGFTWSLRYSLKCQKNLYRGAYARHMAESPMRIVCCVC
ncbi:Aromatic-L-amino-acid decarboxylase [Araneus ventricosus]|uniref:Aromatic-L-amino-acid decarboxylase n=1 Tax=Araneus ventricosus TaxID=182803 RepID=A0A4Y2BMT4_ARAVE|nr:Aromatic-L-amino-acid decarboxylase [Araneus ventricosus]